MAVDEKKINRLFGSKKNKDDLINENLAMAAAIAVKQMEEEERDQRFVPERKGSKATPAQQAVIDSFVNREYKHYFVRGGNRSGKSHTCAYIISHILMENLPGWKRLEKWGSEPILIIWASRQGRQIEDSLWRATKPFLKPGTFREVRTGNMLQKVVMNNGNTLLFISFENINSATEAAQSFNGHYAFIDELPSKAKLLEELQNRVLINSGQFVAAFTPKKPAPEVKRLVENADPRFTVGFRLLFDDNPSVETEDKALQHAKAAQYGPKMQAAILTGDWVDGDNMVFFLDEDRAVRAVPEYYSAQTWRHWESSDPANASGFGLLVLAQDPHTEYWYVVKAKTLSGAQIECPSISVQTIKRETAPYRIEKRLSDPAAASYIREARKLGLKYSQALNKIGAFENTVDEVQEALGRRVFITPEAIELLDEMASYERSEDNPDHIIHRKKFHLVDAFRYIVNKLPKLTVPAEEEAEEEWSQAKATAAQHEWMQNKAKKQENKGTSIKPQKTVPLLQRIRRLNQAFRYNR